MVTSTIGTSSRNYSTLQLWEASLPANLVTDGNSYTGECYNDSEFNDVSQTVIQIGPHTCDATHFVTLTTAAGQSYKDNASVRTNAQKYNQSNGVGLRNTASYRNAVRITGACNYLTITKLQICQNTAGSSGICYSDEVGSSNQLLKDCIVEKREGVGASLVIYGTSLVVANVLVIQQSTSGNGVTTGFGNGLFIGCTIVRPSNITAAGSGITCSYGSPIIQSCAIFGFSTCAGSGFDGTNSKNNATEQASGLPGSSNQHSVTYNATTPFTDADDTGGFNFIPIAATSLAANGYRDSTNAPNDITGTARTATPTIGAWELTGGAAVVNHGLLTLGVG